MQKSSKILLLLFGLSVLGIGIFEVSRPRPLNWRPDFTRTSRDPFGCYVLYQELPGLFPEAGVTPISTDLYTWLRTRDTTRKASLVVINEQADMDPTLAYALLDFTQKGNSVLISSHTFGQTLEDSLGLTVASEYGFGSEAVEVRLEGRAWDSLNPTLDKGYLRTYFTAVDTARAIALGVVRFEAADFATGNPVAQERLNFVRLPVGAGQLLLHTTPYAFGNYHLLGPGGPYAAGVFSYLDNAPLFWDNSMKSGRVVVQSPLRFILAQDALRWAYYLALTGGLLFLLVRSRRQQRIIPLMPPPENTSVAFARTIGDLYFQHGDATDLIRKRIRFFREALRSKYFLKWDDQDGGLSRRIALKSGVAESAAENLLKTIRQLERKTTHTESDLLRLHRLLEPFNL